MAAGDFGSPLGSGLQDSRRRKAHGRVRENRIKTEKMRVDIKSAWAWLLKKFMFYSQVREVILPEFSPPTE
jgi:hypothetical protein